mmetsp:Transcript_26773/g.25798  ORF Transcript_26773/g.25798 Transcript_26773/m.25798 type:complete len:92 (+) Transcript_26773:930-1205(+)
MPLYANPADFFMKVLTIDYPKEKIDEDKIAYLVNKYQQLQEEENLKASQLKLYQDEIKFNDYDTVSLTIQYKYLLWRNVTKALRAREGYIA